MPQKCYFSASVSQSDFLKACTQNTCHHLQAEKDWQEGVLCERYLSEELASHSELK